jgi:hypothetical protein
MPSALRAETIAGDTPRSVKDMVVRADMSKSIQDVRRVLKVTLMCRVKVKTRRE